MIAISQFLKGQMSTDQLSTKIIQDYLFAISPHNTF